MSFSERAVERIKSRTSKVQSWFLDLNLVMGYWGASSKRAYHHTAPVNPLYALHESLVMLQNEGLENAWQRHAMNHEVLKAGVEAMNMEFLVDAAYRLPQLNTVCVPDGIDEAAVRQRLLSQYNLEIGAGLGTLAGKVWRIGLMGFSSKLENITLCVNALELTLKDLGHDFTTGAASEAMLQTLKSQERT